MTDNRSLETGLRNSDSRSERNRSILGQNFLFTPTVIDDIHIKAQLGRYRMRGMALFKKFRVGMI